MMALSILPAIITVMGYDVFIIDYRSLDHSVAIP